MRISRLFDGHGIAWLGFIIFAVCALIIFSDTLPLYAALTSPDSGPYFAYPYRTGVLERLLTGAAFTPHTLYWLLFDSLVAHELTYILDSLMLACAGVYYLTGRRVHPVAAWAGGLALGLSGYTLTLFCAGHRGYFHMFSSTVWAFGLLIRCFETRRLLHFALLGLVLSWGVVYQPDVLVLVGAVAAAYALWLTGHPKSENGSWKLGVWKRIVSVWPRFIVSVLVLGLAGFSGLRMAVTTQIANRDAQIAGVSPQNAATAKKSGSQTDAEKHNRWIFATNWSLPPEDMLEFIVPGVFGDDSMQMPYPYWGRLGRPSAESFQMGRMMPNYRGHTVYLGVVSVIFALFGVRVWFSQRKAKKGLSLQPAVDYSDVPFWCTVWVVCLVLAMGRYTPFYRLFYSIPYMDYIRAPVKFHHLVEVATAFLAGFGIDAFLRLEGAALRRKLMWLSGGMAGALMICALVFLVAKPLIVRHITELGMGQAAQALGGYAIQNLLRSAALLALVAGLAYAAVKGSGRMLVGVGCVVLTVVAMEQAWVARRYVRVIDVESCYRENAVVKAVKKASAGQLANVINYATPNVFAQDWFSTSLVLNGIHNLAPAPDERGTPYERLFTLLQKDPLRLWQALNVQYVIVSRKAVDALLRSGVLRPVLDFELGAGVVRQVQPGEQSLVLAEVTGSKPGARAVTHWKGGVAPEGQSDAMAQAASVVSQSPEAVNSVEKVGAVTLAYESVWGFPLQFATRLTCTSASSVLVLFNQRFDAGSEVLVDGVSVPCYLSDGVWLSAVVPQGTHQVVLRKKREITPAAVSLGVTFVLLIWGIGAYVAGGRVREVRA